MRYYCVTSGHNYRNISNTSGPVSNRSQGLYQEFYGINSCLLSAFFNGT